MAGSAELLCGSLLHAWDPNDAKGRPLDLPEGISLSIRGIPWVLRCLRCGSWRIDVLTTAGALTYRRYVRADSYEEYLADVRETRQPGRSTRVEARRRYLAERMKQF